MILFCISAEPESRWRSERDISARRARATGQGNVQLLQERIAADKRAVENGPGRGSASGTDGDQQGAALGLPDDSPDSDDEHRRKRLRFGRTAASPRQFEATDAG